MNLAPGNDMLSRGRCRVWLNENPRRAYFKERVDNKKIQCYISTRTNRIHNERVKIMVTKTDYV